MEYASDALAQAAYVTNSAYDDSSTTCLLHFEQNVTDSSASGRTLYKGTGVTYNANPGRGFGYQAYFDGSANATLYAADSPDFDFSGGVWTVDMIVYADLSSIRSLFSQATASNIYIYGYINTNGSVSLVINASGSITNFSTSAGAISANTKHHVAFVEDGNSYYIFVDGDVKGSGSSAVRPANYNNVFTIGGYSDTAAWMQFMNGFIDEVRVSKGIARWTSAFTPQPAPYAAVQSYSESTIKAQGSYSLKGVATTDANGKTLTLTIGSPIDLTGVDTLRFDIRSSRTGSNIKIGLHDSGGTTTEVTPNITDSNTWQEVEIDLSGVADANKDAIDSIIVAIVNADSANTFYIDNFSGPPESMTLISESAEAEAEPTTGRFLALVEPVDSITVNTDLKGYISNDDGSNFDEVTLTDEGYFDSTKKILSGNVTLTDRSDKTMVQKIQTFNSKDLKVHAWGMLWK
jgi:hypothetical protein